MKLDANQRRALELLAKAGPLGHTTELMLAHGFTANMVTGLVRRRSPRHSAKR